MNPPSITPERARAIAAGEAEFETSAPAPLVAAPASLINRWLKIGVAILTATTVLSAGVAISLAVFRASERRASEAAIEALTADVGSLRTGLTEANADLECARKTNLSSDMAQAELLIIQAEQFASALDRVDPPPDPAILAAAARDLRAALQERAQTVTGC